MKLPKRNSVKSCPKCGVVFTQERPKRIRYWDGISYEYAGVWRPVKKVEEGERIYVTCSICSFTWDEACADVEVI